MRSIQSSDQRTPPANAAISIAPQSITAEGKTPPFAWQDKRILRRIREQVEDYGSAIAVYNALTVVASDTQKEVFITTHQWLSTLCGLSARTVRRRLEDLKRIGAVEITTPKLKGPCLYRLLTIGHGVRTLGHNGRALGHGTTPSVATIRRIEERKGTPRAPTTKLGTADRIGLEKQLDILRSRERTLAEDTSEQWQRDEHPDKVSDRKELRAEIQELENQLLRS